MEVLQHQIGELKIAASPPPNPIPGDGGLRRTGAWAPEQLGQVDKLGAKPTNVVHDARGAADLVGPSLASIRVLLTGKAQGAIGSV